MPYIITHHESVAPHEWAIAVAKCDIDDDDDQLLTSTVNLVRKSYGEDSVVADAKALMVDDIESGTFSLSHLKAAFREGLPDPDGEGDKPKQLTNYRSQTAEMIAKAALAKVYRYEYPAAPQEGVGNANQPVLGFDGWGIVENNDGAFALALIQVKATDSSDSPPSECKKLADECRRAPLDRSTICRALGALTRLLRGDPLQAPIMRMLESMGRREAIPIFVSPAIVRGITVANPTDLGPIISMANDIFPAAIRAVGVSIGVCLNRFGYRVMSKARGTP